MPQPLGALLRDAIDGGDAVSPDLWHPLRPPAVHTSAAVHEFYPRLVAAYGDSLGSAPEPVRSDDWYRIEIEKVLKVFERAFQSGQAVISCLEPPVGEKRASRVRLPIQVPEGLPS
jgi:hypothetical protein